MVDPISRQLLFHRTLFLGLALGVLFLRLLPLSSGTSGWPGPDITLAITLAWLLRRPEYVPAMLIVAVMLIEDLMFQRPPGLWALIVLGGTEFLRAREASLRDLSFLLEWLTVGVLLLAMVLANRMVLAVLMVPQPALGLSLLHFLATIAVYPLVVIASYIAVGLRRAAPGEVDAFGRRL
ncbi:rod shape-determining protein MreD [Phaeovulum sp.]|jgi:rod shape-determining protein MreD|uniref:rod shape-determining protein MreD n=1 Tax=Phaeovulum sp. TaxID=2934796 RepID=UPI00272FA271|nr:rod shape-determining protein MreD [Phaeovulum sp.]MDP1668646.1 rod shape-determining protein MreD [Phaeovulum sp.]MDP2061586.1 rod shape-determining protein MreD [Phaeovulum sp.]MDP3861258.1 rod shape-determining protein MreD [Phaeovulum sp.]MDZ4119866.1 rod shape-determining protein MreD [Phaeovulum sp.]